MATTTGDTNPRVINHDVTTSETSFSVPAGFRYVSIQCRTAADMRIAFEEGKVAGPTAAYATIKSGSVFDVDLGENPHGVPIYLAAGGSVVAEVICSLHRQAG